VGCLVWHNAGSCVVLEREMSSKDHEKIPGVAKAFFLAAGSLFTKLGQGDLAFLKSVTGRLERIHKPDGLLEYPILLSQKIGGSAVPWGAYDSKGVFHYAYDGGSYLRIRRMSANADGFDDITPSGLNIASLDKFERTFRGDIAYVAEDHIESNSYQHVIVWGEIVCKLPLSFDDTFDQISFGQTDTHWQIAFSYQPDFTSPVRCAIIWSYSKDSDKKKASEKETIRDIKYIQTIDDQICIVGSESSFRDAFIVWGSLSRGFGREVYIFEKDMIVHDGCLQFIIEEDDGAGYKTYKRVTISPEGTMKVEGFAAGVDPAFYSTRDRLFVVSKQRGQFKCAAVDLLIKRGFPEREIWQPVLSNDLQIASDDECVYMLQRGSRTRMRMGSEWPVLHRYRNEASFVSAGSTQLTADEAQLRVFAGQVFAVIENSRDKNKTIQAVFEYFERPAKDRASCEVFGDVNALTAIPGRSVLRGYHFREGTLFLTEY
jgi:hypothetical protein